MSAPTCLACNGDMKESRASQPYMGDELPNVMMNGVIVRTCSSCGEEEIGIPQIATLHKLIAYNLAESEYQLTPGEIRFLRKYLGWSGKDFARHFDVTPETVSRWENGVNVMGSTSEKLLRLSALRVDPIDEYPVPDKLKERHSGWKLEISLTDEWHVQN